MSEINNRRTTQGTKRPTSRKTSDRQSPGTRSGSGRASSSRQSSGSGRQSSADRILAVQNARNMGSGGSRNTARNGSAPRRRNRRRKQGPDLAKILLIVIAVIIFIICVSVGLKSCSKDGDKPGKSDESQETTTEPETELSAEITVNGISINGLTKSEAREKVLEAIGWDLKVSYNGESKTLPNIMERKVDSVLEEAYSKQEAADYTVQPTGLEDHVRTQVDSMASVWDVNPKNGSISSFDKGSGEFKFSGAQNGIMIDRDKLAEDIMAALNAGEYKKTITASANQVEPEITEAEAKANFKRLGTFTTTTTSNKDRNENIRLASEALNGLIIQPGEEFSMNAATGERTTAKGYKPAGAYLNGVLIEEPGGGVCQVSSTLYNAVVFAGLQTTERHAHSYEPSYVTPGEDAMISFGSADMKFINNSKTAVGIKTSFSNQKLTMSIYGNPILEEGVTLSMSSEKIKELDPPAPTYEEDPTMELGVEKVVKEATKGSRWVTNLVMKKDGAVISESFLHNSSYAGKAATIRRNTSGSVLTTEGVTSASEESSSVSETTQPSGPAAPGETESQPQTDGPGFDGPGFEPGTSASAVRPSEEPGSNILPSEGNGPAGGAGPNGPADTTTAAPVVTMPQTQPQTPAETAASPDSGFISPIG